MDAPRSAAGGLNYPGIGCTEPAAGSRIPDDVGSGAVPEGFEYLAAQDRIGEGEAAYRRAVQGLLTWELHRRSGLRVRAETGVVAVGARVVNGFGVGPFRIPAPCEVVWVRGPVPGGGPQWAGFGYGTLPGHPVRGEESFVISLDERDRVMITVTAVAAPANWFYRAGGAVTAWARRRVTSRYLRSARELAAG
ncbi:DUF1990 family protein [Arthrobacter sp. EPSL27]|uniref:DUF1990 family protein n=1 Tax=Arthrobacter sp. EPSL27 TaxID=1745378 RepID=UPI00074ABF75|nr:DUF1990 domain-containing protein [Arthrobacter sp. EPSL27]KUM36746.1 hypothetical protein AR539_04995 [Arthrobacter sp. EPSL27]